MGFRALRKSGVMLKRETVAMPELIRSRQ